jgi:hypothetical protein
VQSLKWIGLVKVGVDMGWAPNEMESGFFGLVVIQEEAEEEGL